MANKGNVQFISNDIAYTDNGVAVVVGSLPPRASIVNVSVLVSTAFDGSGTDLVNVGISGTANKYASAVDVSATGKATSALASDGSYESEVGSTDILATYTDQNSDATAGAAKVIVEFIQE